LKGESLMGNVRVALGLCFIVLAGSISLAQTTSLPLYDNFKKPYIDPARWYSSWQCGPSSTECVRELQGNQLRLRVRGYGFQNTNNGDQFGNSEIFLTSSGVKDIQAQIVVVTATADACSSNIGGGPHAQALINGAFFNGGGGTANDDVQAFLQLDHYPTDPAGVVQVGGFLEYQGTFFGNVYLGPANVGERIIVELKWDQPNHQFIVTLDRPNLGIHLEASMPYGISDSSGAASPFKSLSANVFPANCTGTRASAEDEVLVNQIRTN
jgi:hypothetical protein